MTNYQDHTFGRRLSIAMTERGMSAAQLAERSGYTSQMISNWRADRHGPTLASLQCLVKCLPGVDVTWLIMGPER